MLTITVKTGNTSELIHNPQLKDYVVIQPKANVAVNSAGSASFTIPPSHPRYNSLEQLKSYVEFKDGNKVKFRGRVLSEETNILKEKKILIEGALAYLNDTVIRPFDFPNDFQNDSAYQQAAANGNVIQFFLNWIITQHNAQANSDKQLILGNVTVTDPNNYLARSDSNYKSAWEIIKDKLFDSSLGGFICVRYENNGTYVDYLSSFTQTAIQSVQFAENLIDLDNSFDSSDLYTAILPLGAKMNEIDEESEDETRLTISELPNGTVTTGINKQDDYVYSVDGVTNYGLIFANQDESIWEDVKEASNLKNKAVAKLAEFGYKTKHKIVVKAVDLHILGTAIFGWEPFCKVNVNSPPHGLADSYDLTEITYDFANPENSELVLGREELGIAGRTNNNKRDVDTLIENTYIDINENITQLDTSITNRVNELSTSIINDAQQIVLSAMSNYVETGDFREYQEQLTSQLSVLANEINISINTLTNEIQNVNNDLSSKYENITKYFKFTSDGLIIGETGNEILLRLDNDIMQFLRNNVPELYLNNQGVNASTVTTQTLNLGNFAFIVENDGKLSFKKVV